MKIKFLFMALIGISGCTGGEKIHLKPETSSPAVTEHNGLQQLHNDRFYVLKDKTDNRKDISPMVMDIGTVPNVAVNSTNPLQVERPSADERAAHDEVIRQVNELRAAGGLAPVVADDSLTAQAEIQAKELKETSFGHRRADGSKDQDPKYVKRGYVYPNVGGSYESPTAVVKGWRESPPHYANIMDPARRLVGVGFYHDPITYKSSWSRDGKERYVSNWVLMLANADTESIYSLTPQAPEISGDGVRQKLSGLDVKDVAGKVIELSNGYRVAFRGNSDRQAYGQIEKDGMPRAYVNIGQPYLPDIRDNFSATYRGKAIGDLDGIATTADVNAQVNFGSGAKTLNLQLENSQLNGVNRANLDFSDQLQWNGDHNRFEGSTGNFARFYGSYASEIGGQFHRETEQKVHQGAYGAVVR